MFVRNSLLKLKTKYVVLVVILCLISAIFGVFTHLFERDYYSSFEYPYNGDIHTSVLQLRYNLPPEIPPINSYDYKFITDCSEKCKSDGATLPVRLVFIVKSSPENAKRRGAIRNTWGYEHRFSDVIIRTVFILGNVDDEGLQLHITNESSKYKDIVQADFVDAYFNNTIKTMMGVKWAVKFCPEAKFYMFVDDDYYVSTKNVLRFVRNPANYPQYLQEASGRKKANSLIRSEAMDYNLPDDIKFYAGFVFFSAPHRHITSKWYVSLEEYPYHLWPPYVTAGAYIVSHEALLDMYYTSFYTRHFRFDDVYMGLLARKANIEPFHSDQFYFNKNKYRAEDYRFTVASHGYGSPRELVKVWTEQRGLGNA